MFKSLLTGLVATVLSVGCSFAQSYPTKPIVMIVPFAAGGPTDVVARIVTEHMSRSLGQQIVIENVAGAGGTTGSTRVATASNDGYTIMMGHMGTHGAAPEPEIRSLQRFRACRFGGGNTDHHRFKRQNSGFRSEIFYRISESKRDQSEPGPCGRGICLALDRHSFQFHD